MPIVPYQPTSTKGCSRFLVVSSWIKLLMHLRRFTWHGSGIIFWNRCNESQFAFVIHILGPQKKKKASCLCNDIASITSEPFNLIRSKWEVIRADYNPNLNGAMMSPRHWHKRVWDCETLTCFCWVCCQSNPKLRKRLFLASSLWGLSFLFFFFHENIILHYLNKKT